MQANDFCDICKQPLSQENIDWERWEDAGKLVHKNCIKAKSSIKVIGRDIKQYPDKKIPQELTKKIIKDNTIKVKIIHRGKRQLPDIAGLDKDSE